MNEILELQKVKTSEERMKNNKSGITVTTKYISQSTISVQCGF
ncbi:class III lanthipeptide [Staphylococcus arlettae]